MLLVISSFHFVVVCLGLWKITHLLLLCKNVSKKTKNSLILIYSLMIQIYYLFRDYLEQINSWGELQVEPIERKFRVILSRLSQLREIKKDFVIEEININSITATTLLQWKWAYCTSDKIICILFYFNGEKTKPVCAKSDWGLCFRNKLIAYC